ncbi:MAG: hypothetical protein NVSMB42_26850 [Herpetosiphon sp.]
MCAWFRLGAFDIDLERDVTIQLDGPVDERVQSSIFGDQWTMYRDRQQNVCYRAPRQAA